ncbi:MAG: carbohydrate binding domain-containing protein, partial [Acidobacteria bacterium]|nr:carbohydrate binding domain-containing protein [Acidobacteriota bacterium]
KDTTASPYFMNFAQGTMARNVWANLSGTIDLAASTSSTDCGPANGGLVRSVLLYLNQTEQGCTTGTCPDLYMDDLVVNVTDGRNLVGNPNFEAGFADGWGVSSGSAVQAVVTTFAHGGTHSLRQYTRQTPATGPRYVLPTGYARYDVSLWVMQNGTAARDLILQSTYTCLQGGGAQTPPATKMASQVVPGTWTQLTGTVTMPPANATPGCKLTRRARGADGLTGAAGPARGRLRSEQEAAAA